MVKLYSNKVCELSEDSNTEKITGSLSYCLDNSHSYIWFYGELSENQSVGVVPDTGK